MDAYLVFQISHTIEEFEILLMVAFFRTCIIISTRDSATITFVEKILCLHCFNLNPLWIVDDQWARRPKNNRLHNLSTCAEK